MRDRSKAEIAREANEAAWHRMFPNMKSPRKFRSEKYVHRKVVRYLIETYPHVRFISNLAGEKFGKGQALMVRDLQSHNGAPDLMIFHRMGTYVGLALELKAEDVAVFKKDGSLRKDEHLEEQQSYLAYLRNQGWVGHFSEGYEKTCKFIDNYMRLNK